MVNLKDLAIYFVNIVSILLVLMILSFINTNKNLEPSEKGALTPYLNDVHFVLANNSEQILIGVIKSRDGGPLLVIVDKNAEGIKNISVDHMAFWLFTLISFIVVFVPIIFWKYNLISTRLQSKK